MPVSYQLTNGKCIRLRNSQYSKSLYECENEKLNLYEQSRNIANNNYKDMELNLNVESKSSDYANNIDSAMITIKNGNENVSNSNTDLINDKKEIIVNNNFIEQQKEIIKRKI